MPFPSQQAKRVLHMSLFVVKKINEIRASLIAVGPTSKHSRAHQNMVYSAVQFHFINTSRYYARNVLLKASPQFPIPCSLPIWIKLFSFFFSLHPSLHIHLLRPLNFQQADQQRHVIPLGSPQLELFIVTLAQAMLSQDTATSYQVMNSLRC